MRCARILVGSTCLVAMLTSPPAMADIGNRSDGWNTATNVMAGSSLAVEVLLPRIFFSDPDVTAGWKARWHLSALAPVMTYAAAGLLNETTLKGAFGDFRPGCTDATQGQPGCTSYGLFSTQAFVAGEALGHGVSVFLVDTLKWSGGQIHAGALLGEVGIPLILAPITTVGRTAGNWESGGQAWGSAAIGLGVGLAMGFLYATMQRPECGYTGNLICW